MNIEINGYKIHVILRFKLQAIKTGKYKRMGLLTPIQVIWGIYLLPVFLRYFL